MSQATQNSHSDSKSDSSFDSIARTKLLRKGSKLYIRKQDSSGNQYTEEVANFDIEVTAIIESSSADDKPSYQLEIETEQGTVETVVPFGAFDSTRKFREKVLAEHRTAVFDGGQSELNEIKKYIGHQSAKHLAPTTTFGLHPDGEKSEWVVPGEGSVPEQRRVFQSLGSSIEQSLTVSPTDDVRLSDVADFLGLVHKTRPDDEILPVMGWFYATTLAPVFRQEKGEFGILGIFGETGAAKSHTLKMLSSAFVGTKVLLSPENTSSYSLMSQMASSASVPVIYDEYKPSNWDEYTTQRFSNMLRSTVTGESHTRGSPGSQANDVHHLVSPVAVAGEESVVGNAENRRMLRRRFTTTATTGDYADAYYRIVGDYGYDGVDIQQHADLVHYLALRDCLRGNPLWTEASEFVQDWLDDSEYNRDELSDTEIVNLQAIWTGKLLYEEMVDYVESKYNENRLGEDVEVPSVSSFMGDGESDTTEVLSADPEMDIDTPDDDDWLNALDDVASSMGTSQRTSHLDQFFELLSRAAGRGYIGHGQGYRVMDDNEVRVKFSELYDTLRKFSQDYDVSDIDLLQSYKEYRKRSRDEQRSHEYCNGAVVDGELNRCDAFDGELLDEQVDGFELDDIKEGSSSGWS